MGSKKAFTQFSQNISRVKTPTILQMEAVECGAAALGMVLSYFGKYLPLEVLRSECGIGRDGSNALYLLKAARQYGMEATAYKKDIGNLHILEAPFIVFWNFNHFVVFEGAENGEVYLNDPAVGPRRLTEDEFDLGFTGVVLSLKPTSSFEKSAERPKLLLSLKRHLRGSGYPMLFLTFLTFCLALPGLITPVLIKLLVDHVLVPQDPGWLLPLLAGLFLATLLSIAIQRLQHAILLKLETRLSTNVAAWFFWHTLHLPMTFFLQRYAGELTARFTINDKLSRLISRDFSMALLNTFTIVFFVILMAQYDLTLTAIALLFSGINLVALHTLSGARTLQSQRLAQEKERLAGISIGGLQLIETLKATGGELDFFTRWSGFFCKVMNIERSLNVTRSSLNVLPPFLWTMGMATLLVVGGNKVILGELSLGTLVAFQAIMAGIMLPSATLVGLGHRLQETYVGLNKLEDAYQYPVRDVPKAPRRDVIKLTGSLEIRDLTFGYNRFEPPLLSDFSLSIRPGARVAIVGGSGSGKSTLAKLITGLYTPWSGEFYFDGVLRQNLSKSCLTASLAAVDQDIFLYEGSVRDNLSLWDESISESDYVKAAIDACIHEDIIRRRGGYDSPVEEGGRNFSGGQRQRLEIARALALNPSIILLDEATSALDPYIESQIDANLRRRGCTCVIIAHRLSTIRDSDEIIVLESGQIVERGTHATMIGQNGPYFRLLGKG